MAQIDSYVIVGAGGMLGTAWTKLLQAQALSHRCFDLPELDLNNPATIDAAVPEGTRVVINCAAYTNVDGAEDHEDLANAINAEGVAKLAARCEAVGASLIHYSTDYVFDGSATAPYSVDHAHSPVNAYGRSKAKGEKHLEASGADYLLIRTSWVYAPWAKNFVLTMVTLGETKASLNVVNDQRGRPTSAEHLAATSLKLLQADARGTYHVGDGGDCTWYEFADTIMRSRNNGCKVEPCTTAEFPLPARRPTYGVLDLSKTETLVGTLPSWQENLEAVLKQL